MTHPVLVDPYAAEAATGIRPDLIRQWLRREHLTHHGYDRFGRVLVDLREVQARQERAAA
ncbi:hypothetical protein [Streptomyces sp. NPDC088923]|uniref:hypothetical protein n=1 Tax=Streptomyces sp. NPDC088923 TaxID=3365913 RepID=UPI0038190511